MDTMGNTEDEEDATMRPGHDPFMRENFCIANKSKVLLHSDPGFRHEVSRNLASAESWMLEQTIRLKERLRRSATFNFWQILMEEMSIIMGSQYAFVAKRVLFDDENTIVEMPPLGEPGSCLMGLAFYFNDNNGHSALVRDYKYQVYGCPCQWMKHSRVLLIPDGLAALTPDNPNAKGFPIPAQAYLAVPLMHEEKCFGHFGSLWTADGLRDRPRVSWGMMEMFLHALEDIVGESVLHGLGLGEPVMKEAKKPIVIPQGSVVNSLSIERPSLRPYARRLSHELRTPMQGVVGMLDVMYASVVEATGPNRGHWPNLGQLREVIEGLRASIEVAQDSSKRAVDAADNMVHAYDFNMEVPTTPSYIPGDDGVSPPSLENYTYGMPQPEAISSALDISPKRANKRRRESRGSPGPDAQPLKVPHIELHDSPTPVMTPVRRPSRSVTPSVSITYETNGESSTPNRSDVGYFASIPAGVGSAATTPGILDPSGRVQLTAHPLRLRERLHEAVHHSIRSGGRPDVTNSVETPHGEIVKVETTQASDGTNRNVVEIEVYVDDAVPETMIIDGQALTKLISSVFHNAFKFTPTGRITLTATVVALNQILFSIVDTGQGIPADFLPEMFKPFSREDESLTRNRDGLGLGLMVAKSIAHKMGGSLWCERTSTSGDDRGTEFRIRLPITAGEISSTSTPSTPEPPPVPRRPPSSPVTHPTLPYDPELGIKNPLRILVAEDNRINRTLLCSMLRKLGYRDVVEARDGVEAVELFSSTDGVDLVLMDLWMPRMDGFEAAKQIGGRGSSVNILAVSADATDEARQKAAAVGIGGFVEKPFGLRTLSEAVGRFRALEK